MEANECFIASVGKNWHKISNCNVHMNVKRRLQRTVIRGAEGDDLLDEGAESAMYTITGNMGMAEYKEILTIFRGGQPWFHDPFEERQMKVSSYPLIMTVLRVHTNSYSWRMQNNRRLNPEVMN